MPDPSSPRRRLVIVSGAGRSGTSTMTGTLTYLGLHCPQPTLKPNPSNPRGFFEPVWSVGFHNRLLNRAAVDITDGRPYADRLVAAKLGPKVRERLRAWLVEQTADHPQTVMKDPRTAWTLSTWHEVGAEIGVTTSDLVMLRHPAEVHRSRATHYVGRRRRIGEGFLTSNVTGWIMANLMAERASRGMRRVFVPYVGLLDDWRESVARVSDALGLSLSDDPETIAKVDDFVDPGLRRSAPSWEGLEVPTSIQAIAQGVWESLQQLATAPDGRSEGAEADLDELRDRYATVYAEAEAIATYSELAAERRGRRLQRAEDAANQQIGGDARIGPARLLNSLKRRSSRNS